MIINFYHHTEILVAVGMSDYETKGDRGSREVFNIADDEQLIGCELEHDHLSLFRGVSWLKWKIKK